jgi:hypothetical protein
VDALDFLKHLLDPDRLAVVGLVAAQARTAADLSAAAGVREREVLATLAPLLAAGILERDGDRYALVRASLRELARDLPGPTPPSGRVFFGMTDDERTVLARFFRGDRLVEIPAAHGKRRVALERIALEFEPGRHYAEAEVNAVLTGYHDDYAALRRYLVDERFLDRAEGRYWRAGGRVD